MNQETESPRLLRLPEVSRATGLGRSAIYERMTRGEFPRAVAVTPRARAWVESEVRAWIAERIAQRDAA